MATYLNPMQLRARAKALRTAAEKLRRTAEQASAYLPDHFPNARKLDDRADRLEQAAHVLESESHTEAAVEDEEYYSEE